MLAHIVSKVKLELPSSKCVNCFVINICVEIHMFTQTQTPKHAHTDDCTKWERANRGNPLLCTQFTHIYDSSSGFEHTVRRVEFKVTARKAEEEREKNT